MMKKNIEGNCAICGEFKKLSFEHVPPRCAYNDKLIFVQNHSHILERDSVLYGKKNRSPKGFGGYTLCQNCNNLTGDWYARDFGDFAQQGMSILKSLAEPQYSIQGSYQIKPLNVIKQILTMFMSADKSEYMRSQKDLVDFILTKDAVGLPSRYKVYLYSTLSKFKRMIGYSIVYTGKGEIQKWSEINFQPFGYLLAEESGPAHEHMCDITTFADFKYDDIIPLKITTPYLVVDSPIIGMYGNV